MSHIRPVLLACSAALGTACGPTAPPYPDPVDLGPTRPFQLASTGVQFFMGEPLWIQMRSADLATDVDVVAIHNDFYGVPWAELGAGLEPPAAWVAEMDRLAGDTQAMGKPVFLSLVLSRATLAATAREESGTLVVDDGQSPRCFDFQAAPDAAQKRTAYLRYVEWMIQRFDPAWVNTAVEINSAARDCPGQWPGFVEVANAAYDAAKVAKPSVIAFPSFQLDILTGYSGCAQGKTREACAEEAYQAITGLKRDRFALSAYPYMFDGAPHVADLPDDLLTRAADRAGERLVIAETGWPSDPLTGWAGFYCRTLIDSNQSEQGAYLEYLVRVADARGVDLVTWWSNRDLVPKGVIDCPCSAGGNWCAVLDALRAQAQASGQDPILGELTMKLWGSMGVRRYEGTPKPHVLDRWNQIRAIPIAP